MLIFRRLPRHVIKFRHYFGLFFLSIFIFFAERKYGFLCINKEADRIISQLCDLYLKGQASGNLCKPICTDWTISKFSCFVQRTENKLVFNGEWDRHPITLKYLTMIPDDYLLPSENIKEEDFLRLISQGMFKTFNLSVNEQSLKRLLSVSKNVDNRQQQLSDLMRLFSSKEYILGTIFGEKEIFPQILGNCGQMYAAEFVPEITLEDDINWLFRLKLAIIVMDFFEQFETNFHEPLFACKLRLKNFGIDSMGRLKYLNGDFIYPQSVLDLLLSSQKKCTHDADCDLFDCKSKCQKEKCSSGFVHHTNLQGVCENLLVGWTSSKSGVVEPGILISEYTPSSLALLLRQCADVDRNPVTEDLRLRLYNMLIEMEQALIDNMLRLREFFCCALHIERNSSATSIQYLTAYSKL